MASVANLNHFNNLLYSTKRRGYGELAEHYAARIPMDLSYKGQSPITSIINSGAAQLNGKSSDIKYVPVIKHSRPYYGYDAGYDPTILNSVRNKYVDVSGLLIPNGELPKQPNKVYSRDVLQAYGIVK